MKFIRVILMFNSGSQECTIESTEGIHELRLYEILSNMFPAYIDVNYDDETKQEGYSYAFKNGLSSVAICRF